MRILLTLQYLGTRYAGWQTQSNAVGVQQVIEAALMKMCGSEVRIEGSGRTDSGVHALAQRAHFDFPLEIGSRGIVQGLNDLLPHDIRVTAAEVVADDFHCRFQSAGKTYVYRIWNDTIDDVFHRQTHAFVPQPLDAGRMQQAVSAIAGHHDFRCFTVVAPGVSSTWRTVSSAEVEREGNVVSIRVAADGFLRFMVRRIAGSLIEVGRGKLPVDSLTASLEPTFAPARWTAPARGLTLVEVRFESPVSSLQSPGDSY